ncbi:MAG: hypothetical protein ACRCVY_06560 [Commensalibacter sp.]
MFKKGICFLLLFSSTAAYAEHGGLNKKACTYNNISLYGKVQIVDTFPDLKVENVDTFPDECGKWQFVTAFPDFKVQFVDSFPDITIQYVTAFPGVN